MDDQNKNLILATALSFVVILVWFVLFPPPEPDTPLDSAVPSEQELGGTTLSAPSAELPATGTPITGAAEAAEPNAIDAAPRVQIDTARLAGSVSLLGGRIDDLALKDYRTSLDDDAQIVEVLNPVGQPDAQYALHGWAVAAGVDPSAVPGPNTQWTLTSGETLGVDSPIVLSWDNGAGLLFTKEIQIDDEFMFTIVQSVENTGETAASIAAYGVLARHGIPSDLKNFFILHEGVVGMTDGEYSEIDWDEIPEFEFDPRTGARSG